MVSALDVLHTPKGTKRTLISKYWSKTPDDAIKELGGEQHGKRWQCIWSWAQYADLYASEPSPPAPRTCLCGGLVFLLVMIPYTVLVVNKFLDSKPDIQITNQQAGGDAEAPMPATGISIGDTGTIEGLNITTFLKYVDPQFKYRTMNSKHPRFGRVKTTMKLQVRHDKDCNFEGIKNQSSIFLCVLLDEPYEAKVKIDAQDEEAKQRMGNQETIEEMQPVENLKISGRYNEDLYTWLEIELFLKSPFDNQSLWDNFMIDSNGRKRDHKLNLWFKYWQEAWDTDEGLKPGTWAWEIYDKLPKMSTGKESLEGVHNYHAELTVNEAEISGRRALSSWTQDERKKKWFSWEHFVEKDVLGGTWRAGAKLLEINVKVGRMKRKLKIAYPTFAEMFTDLGADYNVAFFAGVVWTTLLAWLLNFITWSWQTSKGISASKAKESLQTYCTTAQQSLQDKLKGNDKIQIEQAIRDTQDWLEENQSAEKEEYKLKEAELEGIINFILNSEAARGDATPEKDREQPKGDATPKKDGQRPNGDSEEASSTV